MKTCKGPAAAAQGVLAALHGSDCRAGGAGACAQGTLCAYDFGTWDLSWPDYPRWSINVFAFNSSDILDSLDPDARDDEVRCFDSPALHNLQPSLATLCLPEGAQRHMSACPARPLLSRRYHCLQKLAFPMLACAGTPGMQRGTCEAGGLSRMHTLARVASKVYLGQDVPRAARQHCAAVGRSALVVHFAYFVANAELHARAPGLLGQYERCGWPPCSQLPPGLPPLLVLHAAKVYDGALCLCRLAEDYTGQALLD
jgi:hypothetical protein